MSNNGHTSQNGTEQPLPITERESVSPGRAEFTSDDTGASVTTGIIDVRLNAAGGGRLESWVWRTTPPPDALNPATRHNPPRPLALVNAAHGALIDHFLPIGTKLDEFAANTHREFGDFFEAPYTQQVIDLGGEIRVAYVRDGIIQAGKRTADIRLMKSISVRPGSNDLSVHYRVINSSLRPLQILFAVEYNLYAPDLAEHPQAAPTAFYLVDGVQPSSSSFDQRGVSGAATSVTLGNPTSEVALQLGWDRECDLWRMPSTDGTPGAVRLVALWRLSLPPRDNWALGAWLAPT